VTRGDAEGYRLERRVTDFVVRERVVQRGERALLMLSGGADSMALLALLPVVAGRLGLELELAALHVDYAMRGAQSDRDRAIVERACAAAGVPLHVVRLRRKLTGGDFQARARDLRYRHARELAAAEGYGVIVTAHNRDDQAETILYRLAKYASPRGLAGMRPRERLLARPLLCLGAAEIREYCRARGIDYGVDATNAEPVYARNAIRLEVLPRLEAINPRVAETLAGASAMAAAEADVLAAATAAASLRVAAPSLAGDLAAVDLKALAAEPPALRALVLHDRVRAVLGGEVLVERRLVEALLALAERHDDSGRASLGRGVEAVRGGGCLRLRRAAPPHRCAPLPVEGAALAAAGGEGLALAFCGRLFRARLLPGGVFERAAAAAGAAFVGLPAAPRRVTLRHARRGERFAPLDLGAETTVARFLAAARAPAAARARAVVLDVGGAVAWLGYAGPQGDPRGRVAHGYRVDQSTSRTLHIFREDT
jgi:tRNA(Ile)-lysidine synthase